MSILKELLKFFEYSYRVSQKPQYSQYVFIHLFSTMNVNSPVLQSARPRAVTLASYTGVDKIIKSTVGFTRKDIWID